MLFEFMTSVYGYPMRRLSGVGVTASSGVITFCSQAFGLAAAISEKRDQSRPRWARCSSGLRPAAARRATSNRA